MTSCSSFFNGSSLPARKSAEIDNNADPIFDKEGAYVHGAVSKGWKMKKGRKISGSHRSAGAFTITSQECAVPLAFRQREQWQFRKRSNGPSTSNAISPHRQLPRNVGILVSSPGTYLVQRSASLDMFSGPMRKQRFVGRAMMNSDVPNFATLLLSTCESSLGADLTSLRLRVRYDCKTKQAAGDCRNHRSG
jgi:hypothetical protein